MTKRKILFIGNKLAKRGGNVTTIDFLSEALKTEGYTVYTASSKRNKLLRMLDMLFSVITYRNSIDVVLIDTYSTQNFLYAVYVAKLCRFLKMPYMPILHGGNLPERLQNSPKQSKKLFGNAEINIAPSQYLMKEFNKKGFENLIHIPNSILLENYPFKLRERVQPKLLWVRSFAEIYNPMLAITIVESLMEKGFKPTLCMIGPEKDGSLQRCQTRVSEKNLPVSFTGKLEKSEWISRSKEFDIFINTTHFDNLPVSVIEAMALGMPVISTNVGGIPFLIENGKDGILVPPNDVKAFTDAIVDLLDSEQKAIQLSKNGRTKSEGFNWKLLKHSWFTLLNE